jgi:uncharacterized RDD family membrane protein YckC
VIVARYSDDEQNPFAAPASDLAPEAFRDSVGTFVYAGFWARFVAVVVDQIIVQLVTGFVKVAMVAAAAGADRQTILSINLLNSLFSVIFMWLYYALQESSNAEATLGKRAMSLRVLDLSGEKISFGRATGRHFGKILSGLLLLIGYLMQPFTERRQTLHDLMAGCIVVKG